MLVSLDPVVSLRSERVADLARHLGPGALVGEIRLAVEAGGLAPLRRQITQVWE